MNCKSNDQFELNEDDGRTSNQKPKKITFNHKKSYGKIIVKAKSCKIANPHFFSYGCVVCGKQHLAMLLASLLKTKYPLCMEFFFSK